MPKIRVHPRTLVRPSLRVAVDESEAPLSSREFAHFLYLFRAAYVHCIDFNLQNEQLHTDNSWLCNKFSSSFYSSSSPRQVERLFNTDLEDDEFELPTITKSSPLGFICYGVTSALVAAAILSGGKVDLKFMKVTLPPLGVGIRSLRQAFKLPPSKAKKRKKKK